MSMFADTTKLPLRRLICAIALAAAAGTLMGSSKLESAPQSEAGRNQLRCWQYGRLIIDVAEVEAPTDSAAYTLKLRGADRAAVYLVQSGTSTCLIQRSILERPRLAPRK